MDLRRLHLASFALSLAFAACSAPAPRDAATGAAAAAAEPVERDLAALQRLERVAVRCAADGDCPVGSHCDGSAQRCAFSCLADSDCGDNQSCNGVGSCVRSVHATPYLSVSAAGCASIPVAQRLAAVADLRTNPVTCFADEDCPCGSYCGGDATCQYDCFVDNPTSQPLCSTGLVCSGEGRCIQPDHSNDPTYIVDLQLSPSLVKANTASAAVVVPATVRVRAKQASFTASAANVKVTFGFAPSVTTALPRVRCAAAAALASSCDLTGGWLIGDPADPLLSQPRTIWIELPRDTNADSWMLQARSAWSDTVASLTVSAQPAATPHPTGHFAGTLSWPQANGDPLALPIEAYVTATRVALIDPSRVLLPDGPAVLSRSATQTTQITWLKSEASAPLATVNLDIDTTWAFDGAHDTMTGGVILSAANGQAPTRLAITMKYAGPPTTSCTANSACAAGNYCNGDIGLCLPGSAATSAIYTDGAVTPGIVPNTSVLLQQWGTALTQLRANNPATLGGGDIIGLERATCFNDPAQTTAGRLGSNDATPSLDVMCADGKTQQMFPYADATQALTKDANGNVTFDLLKTCADELSLTPTQPLTPQNLLKNNMGCVSLARYLLAVTTPANRSYPQVARRRLENQLTREWLTLHALIARTATQEREYDEIAGLDDLPAADRLGNYVDLLDRDFRLVVRPKRGGDADTVAAQRPDYRTLARPVAYWSFNQHLDGAIPDEESGAIPMRFSHLAQPDDQQLTLRHTGVTYHGLPIVDGASCSTDVPVALPSRHFSLVGEVGASGIGPGYVLFDKTNPTDGSFFRISVYDETTTRSGVIISDNYNNSVSFDVAAAFGYWGLVVDGDSYTLYTFVNDASGQPTTVAYAPTSIIGGGPSWGTPGPVTLGCNPPAGLVILDDFSLWDKPLMPEAIKSMIAQHAQSGTALEPKALALGATDEQATGLAVHLVDAAAAEMSLLGAYVHAEEGGLFTECGNPSGPVHARVLGRVGRGLRFAALMENDAADLVALAGSTAQPWLSRYQSTQKLLAGKRADVVHQLDVSSRCLNPLGISETDLPLFHGEAVGDAEKFFASSRWLTAQAHAQIDQANSELVLARTAWEEQRVAKFQETLAPAETAERVQQLQSQYESQIRRYCGAPATGTIMAALANGTMTTSNCFIKLEQPGCAGMDQRPIQSVPASCLRGEIGEQIVAVQAAGIDVDNAVNGYDRAIAQFDTQVDYCALRSSYQAATLALQQAHRTEMQKLRDERENDGFLVGYAKNLVQAAVGGAAGNPQAVISASENQLGADANYIDQKLSHTEQDEESSFQLELAARANVLDKLACLHESDGYKFAADAAHDVIKRAYQSSKASMLHLANLQTEVTALVAQARGDIEVEQNMPRVLPHHHYWLSDHIDAYRRHFRYAQRLTYLALRAFEYESQQSIGYRNDVLTARTLDPLVQVTMVLDQHTAPLQGDTSFTTGSFAAVMSLRDEILGLGTSNPPPGFPVVDATTALRNYLKSDAAKIYDGNTYLGRGLRFSVTPPGWAQFSCAERLWRVTTALQVQGSPINNAQMVLWQENSFGSQQCHATPGGKLHVANIQPDHNLLVDDAGSFDGTPFVTPLRYTAMLVDGLGNKTRDDLVAMTDGRHSGFAGRGLYANYVLLFPQQQFEHDNPTFFDNVKDVLFRFDLVEATNITGNPNL